MTLQNSNNQSITKIIIFVLIMLTGITLQAQKTKKVSGEGIGYHSDIIKAKESALFEAKKDALREAGVFEQVMSLSTVYIGNNNSFSQTNSEELSFLVIDGKVKLLKNPTYTSLEINSDDGIIKVKCSIFAEVLTEEEQDGEFDLLVNGFQQAYRDGDTMGFSFISNQDCYMRLFYFDHSPVGGMDGNMDYPDADGRFEDVKFNANTEISFPSFYGAPEALKRSCKWIASNTSTEPIQTTYILIVVLKRQRPFLGEVTYDRVLNWLWKIPANERCVHWQAVQIVKKTK